MSARIFSILCLTLLVATALFAPAADQPVAGQGKTYALLVGGLGGQELYARWYEDWLGRFRNYLTKDAGVPPERVTTLSGTAATAEAVTGALGKFARQVEPGDQFILFIVGHGEISGNSPTLVLPGPDLTADQLSVALNAIRSRHQVILNFSASSGDFLKHLVSPDRVNLTATSPTEVNEPVFAEFFLRGLESKRAGANGSGAINMLDACNWATQQTALWIVRWQQTGLAADGKPDAAAINGPTTWKASGKETIEIFEKLYGKASDRKIDPASDRNAADAAGGLVPPNGQVTDEWKGRRVVDEHAMLEDSGQEIGVSALTEKGFQPILGEKPGDPGYVARLTILGNPSPSNP